MYKIFLIFLILLSVIGYEFFTWYMNLVIYKRDIEDPEFFYMVPRLYQLFYVISDLKSYNTTAYTNAVEMANSFCQILWYLNIDPSVEMNKRKALLERLDFYRLETLGELHSLFIRILPEKVLLNKLKGTIGIINREMLYETEEIYKLCGLDHSEKSKVVPYNSLDKTNFHFYIN